MMVTPNEIKRGSMTQEKENSDKVNPILHYIFRPISYCIAAPLVSKNVTATQVTIFSLFPALLCIPFIAFSNGIAMRVIGGSLWFLWAVLDCVDGNIARYTHSSSSYGEMWDSTCGYIIIWAWPVSAGMAAYFDSGNALVQLPIDTAVYAFLGGLTSVFAIFPRLLMHRARAEKEESSFTKYRDKSQFSLIKRGGSLIINPMGLPIFLYFTAVFSHCLNLFVMFYFCVFSLFCLMSCRQILRDCR